ncbi:MAG: PKD domain-containing protein [Planctomycetota bacterium]|jgi:hypothetical protein
MKEVVNSRVFRTILLLIALFALSPVGGQAQDGRPIADAGLSRYAAGSVALDGTGSYDPDNSDPLTYEWRQISGPSVVITDANTNTPTISGPLVTGRSGRPTPGPFIQTDEIQECEFELIVSDGEFISLPDTVKVIIVPVFTDSKMVLENNAFDPNKPTIVYFGGGSASNLGRGGGSWGALPWMEKANIISFELYLADPGSIHTWNAGPYLIFSRCADIIIVYLSVVAPDYREAVQTMGLSLGGVPAIDVALRLNRTYADTRYTVNRVSFLDATASVLGPDEYRSRVADFLASSVEGEQCWLDSYDSAYGRSYSDVMNVRFETRDHQLATIWYRSSLIRDDMNQFNSGVIAGAYWSVIGPGKNLQLASTPIVEMYKFTWYGDGFSGYMDFYNEPNHPGRLPEPVTLVGPEDGAIVDANGAVFSCEESENAVGYQLLFGPDPYRVMDYAVVSDTPSPPVGTISEFPYEKTWWTVRAYDSFGSTIHADPRCINAVAVSPPMTLPNVLYVHKSDIEAAESFQSLLVDYGCPTTLISVADVPASLLDSYDLVIVANDTKYETTWSDPNTVAAIEDSGKPIIGLGDGGYDFFGLLGLSVGYPNGGHGSRNSIEVVDPNSSLYRTPYSIEIPTDRVLQLYTETNHVGLYFWPTIPETVTVFGREVNDPGFYPLAIEHNRYLLWGFTESPQKMTEVGKTLFINIIIQTANRALGS